MVANFTTLDKGSDMPQLSQPEGPGREAVTFYAFVPSRQGADATVFIIDSASAKDGLSLVTLLLQEGG